MPKIFYLQWRTWTGSFFHLSCAFSSTGGGEVLATATLPSAAFSAYSLTESCASFSFLRLMWSVMKGGLSTWMDGWMDGWMEMRCINKDTTEKNFFYLDKVFFPIWHKPIVVVMVSVIVIVVFLV